MEAQYSLHLVEAEYCPTCTNDDCDNPRMQECDPATLKPLPEEVRGQYKEPSDGVMFACLDLNYDGNHLKQCIRTAIDEDVCKQLKYPGGNCNVTDAVNHLDKSRDIKEKFWTTKDDALTTNVGSPNDQEVSLIDNSFTPSTKGVILNSSIILHEKPSSISPTSEESEKSDASTSIPVKSNAFNKKLNIDKISSRDSKLMAFILTTSKNDNGESLATIGISVTNKVPVGTTVSKRTAFGRTRPYPIGLETTTSDVIIEAVNNKGGKCSTIIPFIYVMLLFKYLINHTFM